MDKVTAEENRDIHHEDLRWLTQHDWYVRCFETNHATYIEDSTYCVVVKECGQIDEISFTCLNALIIWAGY